MRFQHNALKCLQINQLVCVIIWILIEQAITIQYQWGTLTYIKNPLTPLHILADTHTAGAWISSTTTLTGFVDDPQIIFSVYRMHFENTITGGYVFQLAKQTKTSFKIFVNATAPQKIYNVWIKYLAFVDKNKQVINQEILNPKPQEIYIESHFNRNFIMAIPIINYLCYTSAFTFKFEMPTIDSSSVQMKFLSTGISKIGFQILFATQSPIYIHGTTQWTPGSLNLNLDPYIVQNVQIPKLQQTNIIRFPLYIGLTADLSAEVNIEDFDQLISTELSFRIGSSITSSVTSGWFDYMLIQPSYQLTPLLLQTFSLQEYYEASGTQLITVELPLLQTTYTSNTNWIDIDNTVIGLQIEITTECPEDYQHNYWFLGSVTVTDNQKYIEDYFYCSDDSNRIKYIINLNDAGKHEYKTIKFVFTSTSLEMHQQLDNQQFDEEYRNLKIVINQVR
ncbi:unnamed protein product [Paramecium sonneborni]|uniref:H-type lectin domain-containing protein n=1 Tax=Paramecium sonneborni TaxID=65129 RepID=A0A8S1M4I0_9CILI|nr:unnamed protein product [Paramecium sonneborni]